jgi:3-oxoadipate CoA-transferase beta subunit
MMARGGHIDVALLGAYQVAESGDLANGMTDREDKAQWTLPLGPPRFAFLCSTRWRGLSRLLRACTYPLTAAAVVKHLHESRRDRCRS